MMPYSDLFIWWVISISWSIAFLIMISVYLYAKSRTKRKQNNSEPTNVINVGKNFAFVWVLLGLLLLYISSVQIRSIEIFAAGNIIVETILILYVIRYRTEKPR